MRSRGPLRRRPALRAAAAPPTPMRADLHIHTTASDGTWTPAEAVARVQEAGIGLFAIADHDTLEGALAAADIVRRTPGAPALLLGVEISTVLNGTLVHILGYGVRPDHPELARLLRANRERLEWVNVETLRRMARAGYPVDLEAYAAYENDPRRGGWKGLNFLIDSGLCRDVRDFFERIFVDPIRPPDPGFPHPAEAIARIREASGVPVLAHPGASLRGPEPIEMALEQFLDFGIGGVECYTPYHSPQMVALCREFCIRHGLLVTGGSDCHGTFADRRLGVPEVTLNDLHLGMLERVLVAVERAEIEKPRRTQRTPRIDDIS
ncbi:MAG: PHP domain-containing protein [Anaerolineae bacterium]|nr:PHP domain-containing protein [Anaerolineae bacterium]